MSATEVLRLFSLDEQDRSVPQDSTRKRAANSPPGSPSQGPKHLRTDSPGASGDLTIADAPLATPATPYVLPPELKLDPDIDRVLQELQTALDADPTRTDEVKQAGPGADDLLSWIRQDTEDAALKNLTKKAIDKVVATAHYFSSYLKIEKVNLADALADLPTFEKYAQAAVDHYAKINAPIEMAELHILRAICFPKTPARLKVKELLDLADKGLCFAGVCRIGEGPQYDEVNKRRAMCLIQVRDEMRISRS